MGLFLSALSKGYASLQPAQQGRALRKFGPIFWDFVSVWPPILGFLVPRSGPRPEVYLID
jgi:hypothetical protein